MQNSIWKMTAMVGVVGIGLLVVVQAQRTMSSGLDPTGEEMILHEIQPRLDGGIDGAPSQQATSEWELSPALHAAQTEPTPESGSPSNNPDNIGGSFESTIAPWGPPGEQANDAGSQLSHSTPSANDPNEQPFGAFDDVSPSPATNTNQPSPFPGINDPNVTPAANLSGGQAQIRTANNEGSADSFTKGPFGEQTSETQSNEKPIKFSFDPETQTGSNSKQVGESRLPSPFNLGSSTNDKRDPAETSATGSSRDLDRSFQTTGATSRPVVGIGDSNPKDHLLNIDNSKTTAIDESRFRGISTQVDPTPDNPTLGPNGFAQASAAKPPVSNETAGDNSAQPFETPPNPFDQKSNSETKQQPDTKSLFEEKSNSNSKPEEPVFDLLGTKRSDNSAKQPAEESQPKREPARLNLDDMSDPIRSLEEDDLNGVAVVKPNSPRGLQTPSLELQKIAPANAVLGKHLVYSIVVKNQGSITAHKVIIKDPIPKGTKLVGSIPRAELIDKRLVWRFDMIKPGESKTLKVKVIPTSEGQIGSIATVTFAAHIASRTVVTAPRIQLRILAPKQVKVGDAVEFAFEVSNSGSEDATKVVLRDIIPVEFRHSGGNDLEYTIGTVPAGKSRTVTLVLTADRPGISVNRGIISVEGTDSAESKLEVQVVGQQLKVSRTGTKKRYLGRPATYKNVVTNTSGRVITSATLVETIPSGMDFVSASNGGQYDSARGLVAWRIDRLDAKESQTFEITLRPTKAGILKSHVQVTDANGATDETTTESNVIGFSSLAIEIVNKSPIVAVGENITLIVRVRNRGDSTDTNMELGLVIPNELTLVSARGPVRSKEDGKLIEFSPVREFKGGTTMQFELVLSGSKPGDARLKAAIVSDQMNKPLLTEEAIVVFKDE